MRLVLVLLFFAIIGFWGALYVKGISPTSSIPETNVKGAQDSVISQPITPSPLITLQPPRQAIQGTFSNIEGEVNVFKRNEVSSRQVTEDDTVLDAETVGTGEDSSAVITFKDVGAIKMLPSSAMTFVSTLRNSFLVEQTSGSALYAHNQNQGDISIRSLGVLISLQNSTVQVDTDIDYGVVTVTPEKGTATIALLDAAYNTQVITVESGEYAVVDTPSATVEVLDAE